MMQLTLVATTLAAWLLGSSTVTSLATSLPLNCTATSCNFYLLCDETEILQCCANGTRAPNECFGPCPDTHCGQVDAAPSIPPSLFKPEHSLELSEYIKFTEDIQMQDPFCAGVQNPKLGSCSDQGYKYKHANEPGREITWAGYPHGINPNFYPSVVFEKTCLSGCGCCANIGTQAQPGSLPECNISSTVPTCTDTPVPSAPEWCGVCGPTLNADRFVDFYFTTRVQNVCEPKTDADKTLCAAATGALSCRSHPRRCVWRAPGSLGQCVLGNSTVCEDSGGGVFCGAHCLPSFDCAKCRTATRETHGDLPWATFQMCCDGCELCVATGNGTYTDETDCAKKDQFRSPCVWKKK
jgi:hypothetical protein